MNVGYNDDIIQTMSIPGNPHIFAGNRKDPDRYGGSKMIYGIIVLLAILCIASYFFVPTAVFAIFIVIWLLWSIFALVITSRSGTEAESVFSRMRKNDKAHVFSKYINSFVTQDNWLTERVKTLQDFSPQYLDLVETLKDAMNSNFEKANNYMKACDYHNDFSRREYSRKVEALYQNNCEIIERINVLIGQLAELENSVDDVNMERIDDVIAALKEIQ